MPSPLVLVSVNAGPANPTGLNGLDVTPAGAVVVTLQSPAGVTNWYLQVGLVTGNPPVVTAGTGTDETQVTPPVLTGVNGSGLVTGGPTGSVSFTFPGVGTTLLFSSTVTGTFGSITTTFGLFAPTTGGYRVGAAGMSREGSAAYGWASIVNPAIRTVGTSGVDSVTGTSPIASSGGANPIISFAILNQAQGDIVYFNGTFWVRLPAGTPGGILETLGSGQNPQWSSLGGDVTPGATVGNTIPLEITGIRNTSVPALSTGFLFYNGTAFSWASSAGGFTTYSQDCTAGGTVVYAGPTSPIPNEITLTGTPGGAFTFQMPTGQPFLTTFINTSGQTAFVVNASSPGSGVTVGNQPILLSCQGTLVQPAGVLTGSGDTVFYNANEGLEIDVASIGSANKTSAGVYPNLPIYGITLNPQDALANGITPPTIGAGPPGGQTGHRVWEATYSTGDPTLAFGWLALSQSGASVNLAPEVFGTINTQACFHGALKAVATVVGQSSSGTFDFDIPSGTSAKLEVTITGRVVIVGTGGIESAGDTYSVTTFATVKNVGGVVSVVPNFYALPFEDFDPSMADVDVGITTTGTQASITFANGTLIGTGCSVDYQIDVEGRIC